MQICSNAMCPSHARKWFFSRFKVKNILDRNRMIVRKLFTFYIELCRTDTFFSLNSFNLMSIGAINSTKNVHKFEQSKKVTLVALLMHAFSSGHFLHFDHSDSIWRHPFNGSHKRIFGGINVILTKFFISSVINFNIEGFSSILFTTIDK